MSSACEIVFLLLFFIIFFSVALLFVCVCVCPLQFKYCEEMVSCICICFLVFLCPPSPASVSDSLICAGLTYFWFLLPPSQTCSSSSNCHPLQLLLIGSGPFQEAGSVIWPWDKINRFFDFSIRSQIGCFLVPGWVSLWTLPFHILNNLFNQHS